MLDLKIKDEDNIEANEKLDKTITSLNIIKNKLNIAVEDRVIKPSNKELTEYFLIMKNLDADPNTDYIYYVIRGQKRYITKKKASKESNYKELLNLECVPKFY